MLKQWQKKEEKSFKKREFWHFFSEKTGERKNKSHVNQLVLEIVMYMRTVQQETISEVLYERKRWNVQPSMVQLSWILFSILFSIVAPPPGSAKTTYFVKVPVSNFAIRIIIIYITRCHWFSIVGSVLDFGLFRIHSWNTLKTTGKFAINCEWNLHDPLTLLPVKFRRIIYSVFTNRWRNNWTFKSFSGHLEWILMFQMAIWLIYYFFSRPCVAIWFSWSMINEVDYPG